MVHGLRSCGPWSGGSINFRCVARMKCLVKGHSRGKLFTSWQSRSRPVEEGTRDKITREKINKDLLRNP